MSCLLCYFHARRYHPSVRGTALPDTTNIYNALPQRTVQHSSRNILVEEDMVGLVMSPLQEVLLAQVLQEGNRLWVEG